MKRIAKMEYEMSFQEQFDRVLVNDQLEVAVQTAQEWFEELIG
jgi:guanylate kinase